MNSLFVLCGNRRGRAENVFPSVEIIKNARLRDSHQILQKASN